MHYRESARALKDYLNDQNIKLRSITPDILLDVGIDFWLENNVEGVLPNRGDGLLAYFSIVSRSRKSVFEFGINRLFRLSEFDPESSGIDNFRSRDAFGLSLRLGVVPNIESLNFNPVPWSIECWDKSDSAEFKNSIITNERFIYLFNKPKRGSNIEYFACRSPALFRLEAGSDLHWGIC